MIDLAQTMEDGQSSNIQWIVGLGEEFEGSDNKPDLIVAASSIHWMEHRRLFPRLRSFASAGNAGVMDGGKKNVVLEPRLVERAT